MTDKSISNGVEIQEASTKLTGQGGGAEIPVKGMCVLPCSYKNKTPAKAFTAPAKTKMITRPGRAVTRVFFGGVVYSLISVLPNEFLFKSVIIY